MKTALTNFQTLPLKDAACQRPHAFQEIENKPFIIHPSSFILSPMHDSTLSNDPLSDKRFDFQFVNPSYGYEWSKDDDAVTTREPMQINPIVRQRPGQRGIKPETLPALLSLSFTRFTFQRGQLFSSTQICVCPGLLAESKAADAKRHSRDLRRQTFRQNSRTRLTRILRQYLCSQNTQQQAIRLEQQYTCGSQS